MRKFVIKFNLIKKNLWVLFENLCQKSHILLFTQYEISFSGQNFSKNSGMGGGGYSGILYFEIYKFMKISQLFQVFDI